MATESEPRTVESKSARPLNWSSRAIISRTSILSLGRKLVLDYRTSRPVPRTRRQRRSGVLGKNVSPLEEQRMDSVAGISFCVRQHRALLAAACLPRG